MRVPAPRREDKEASGRMRVETDPYMLRPLPAVWILATVLCVAVVAACVIGGARTEGRRRALLIATAVGVLFGVVSVLTKVTVQRLNTEGPLGTLIVPAPYLVVILGVGATLLQQSAFHAGALQTSVPTMLVLEPLVAVSLGVIVLRTSQALLSCSKTRATRDSILKAG